MTYLSKKIIIKEKIHQIRNLQVMLDSEISELFGIETRAFNQAVKRNLERFPEEFRFQLTEEECANLRSQFVISKS
jgi:hypothetical protein